MVWVQFAVGETYLVFAKTHQNRPCGLPTLLQRVPVFYQGVMPPGFDVDHPPPFSGEVET